MSEARVSFICLHRLLRVNVMGEVSDDDLIGPFELLLRERPEVRTWPTLVDMREYDGTVTWRGIMRLGHIRGAAERGPMNRTAVVAPIWKYEELIGAVNAAYGAMIGRRVRLFETEEEAMQWLAAPP